MKNKAYQFYILIVLLAALSAASCDFLEIPPPKDQLVQDNVYTSDVSAEAVVSGIYSTLIGGGYLDVLQIVTELDADNLTYNSTDQHYTQFEESKVGEENSLVNLIWSGFYKTIYQCNATLQGLRRPTDVTQATRQQLTGEVLVIRAFAYYYLVNLWGDVPLVIGDDYQVNQKMPRTPQAEIYSLILSDLDEAAGLLSDTYPSADKARVNRDVAHALSARVNWMLGNWQEAERASTVVIESTHYSMAEIEEAFVKSSNETIWQLMPHNRPAQFPTYVPGTADVIPIYQLPASLINVMENTDARKQSWIGVNTVDGRDYYYPLKYKLASATENTPPVECMVMLRLADQYLIRAEARVMQGNLSGALEDILKIRQRAGLKQVTGQTREEILSAIMRERQLELFTEWGNRWLNLKRFGKGHEAVDREEDVNWESFEGLWPIPLTELQRNPFLVQNPTKDDKY